MAAFLVAADGKIAIRATATGGDQTVIHANAWDGKPFVPGEHIEIPDDRLRTEVDKWLAPLNMGKVVIDDGNSEPFRPTV